MAYPDHPRVILVGGAPMSGKSTIARAMAAGLDYSVIATDDLGAAVRGVTGPVAAPDLFAAHAEDHCAYYLAHSVEEMLEHAQRSHRTLWPAIESVIHEHATWAGPSIVEGWALLPDLVAKLDSSRVAAAWIEIPETIIEARVRAKASFYSRASDPERMIRQFTRRSEGFRLGLRARTSALRMPLVRFEGTESPEEASRAVFRAIEGRAAV